MHSNDKLTLQEKVDKWVREYNNYITIFGLLILNILISVMVIEDGKLIINQFENNTWLDWLLWSILIIIPSVIAVLVRTSFRKEGIVRAKLQYQDLVDEYLELVRRDPNMRIRSEREFLTENAAKHTVKTLLGTLIISFFSANLLYGADTTGILRLFINMMTSIVIGFKAFSESYNYGKEELKIWYKLEIKRLKDTEYDAMVKAQKYLGDGDGVT